MCVCVCACVCVCLCVCVCVCVCVSIGAGVSIGEFVGVSDDHVKVSRRQHQLESSQSFN